MAWLHITLEKFDSPAFDISTAWPTGHANPSRGKHALQTGGI